MTKKLMLIAAFAGMVMFLAAGCCGFGKSCCDSCKNCDDKGACPMKAEAPAKAGAPVKAETPAK